MTEQNNLWAVFIRSVSERKLFFWVLRNDFIIFVSLCSSFLNKIDAWWFQTTETTASVFPEMDTDLNEWLYGRAYLSGLISSWAIGAESILKMQKLIPRKVAKAINIWSFRLEIGRLLYDRSSESCCQPSSLLFYH